MYSVFFISFVYNSHHWRYIVCSVRHFLNWRSKHEASAICVCVTLCPKQRLPRFSREPGGRRLRFTLQLWRGYRSGRLENETNTMKFLAIPEFTVEWSFTYYCMDYIMLILFLMNCFTCIPPLFLLSSVLFLTFYLFPFLHFVFLLLFLPSTHAIADSFFFHDPCFDSFFSKSLSLHNFFPSTAFA